MTKVIGSPFKAGETSGACENGCMAVRRKTFFLSQLRVMGLRLGRDWERSAHWKSQGELTSLWRS